MEKQNEHYFYKVSYSLFTKGDNNESVLVEQTSNEEPFSFISGLGVTLERFETEIMQKEQNEEFQFTIPQEQAYGAYVEEHVLELERELFVVNGKFDEARIYPGAVVPMSNEDGNHFEAIVKDVRTDKVVMDFNHPLAGMDLDFRGKVLEKRLATEKEIEDFLCITHSCECNGHCHCSDEGEEKHCECGHCHHEEGHCHCGK